MIYAWLYPSKDNGLSYWFYWARNSFSEKITDQWRHNAYEPAGLSSYAYSYVQLKKSKSGYVYIWNEAATKIEKLAVQGRL